MMVAQEDRKEARRERQKIDLHVIDQLYRKAVAVTADMPPDQVFDTPTMLEHLKRFNEAEATYTRLRTLERWGIVRPQKQGKRNFRRYSREDLRLAFVSFELKSAGLRPVEISGWVRAWHNRLYADQLSQLAAMGKSAPPTEVQQAYYFLRSRFLGILLTSLAGAAIEEPPADSLVLLRSARLTRGKPEERERFSDLSTQDILARIGMHFYLYARSDQEGKFFLHDYGAIDEQDLPKYRFHAVVLVDEIRDSYYECIVGLPRDRLQEPTLRDLDRVLSRHHRVNLRRRLPGLGLLIKIAFPDNMSALRSDSVLGVMANAVVSASPLWTYCAILLPFTQEDGSTALRTAAASEKFPRHLSRSTIPIGHFLPGWAFQNNQPIFVERTVPNDPRIAYYRHEEPMAAAAIPAKSSADPERPPVGVIYVGRQVSIGERENATTEEMFAVEDKHGLQALGYVLGEFIQREMLEKQGTLATASALVEAMPWKIKPRTLSEVLDTASERLAETSIEEGIDRWLVAITVQIGNYGAFQRRSQMLADWLDHQFKEITARHLQSTLQGSIEICDIRPGQFAALSEAVQLPEENIKDAAKELRRTLSSFGLRFESGPLQAEVFVWAVSFSYTEVHKRFFAKDAGGAKECANQIEARIRSALVVSPYISRGHDCKDRGDYDTARKHFEDAYRQDETNQYVVKHLAESLMLIGDYRKATRMNERAVQLDPLYASAHSQVGQCYEAIGQYGKSIAAFDKAVDIKPGNAGFWWKYGNALVSMGQENYEQAIESLRKMELDERPRKDEFYLEAIEKYYQALDLELADASDDEVWKRARARYHWSVGQAFLQGQLPEEAAEEFRYGLRFAEQFEQIELSLRIAEALSRQSVGGARPRT